MLRYNKDKLEKVYLINSNLLLNKLLKNTKIILIYNRLKAWIIKILCKFYNQIQDSIIIIIIIKCRPEHLSINNKM